MNKFEKNGIIEQIELMEQEKNIDGVKELLAYLKGDVESC